MNCAEGRPGAAATRRSGKARATAGVRHQLCREAAKTTTSGALARISRSTDDWSDINISSGAARGAGAIGVHYNASKAGMEGLTRGYAARLVKDGITVNAVAPSLIATDMMGGRTDLARNIPLGRMGQAEEVAQAVAMVLGNDYMTGQTIMLNGGMAFI